MMKMISKLCMGGVLVMATSCSPEELPKYEDVDRVYFEWVMRTDRSWTDNKAVSFGYDTPVKPDSVITVWVRALGRVSDANRPITAEVIRAESSAIPDEEIEILPSVIPAGKLEGELRIRLINTERLQNEAVVAKIRLTPNQFFHVDLNKFEVVNVDSDGLEYFITFDAKSDMPNLWKDSAPSTNLRQYFGEWSRVKEEVIYRVTRFTREDFTYDPSAGRSVTDIVNELLPGELAFGVCVQIGRYLRDYREGNTYFDGSPGKPVGEPLYDENGNEVKVAMNGTY